MYDQCLKGLDITYPYYYFYPKYWHGNLLNEDITKYKKVICFNMDIVPITLKLVKN